MDDSKNNVNGLTHQVNAERLEELFSASLEAFMDIESAIKSPSEIRRIISEAQATFSEINTEYLASIWKGQPK